MLPEIPPETLAEWQRVVDLTARLARVPASLIMRTERPTHTVLVSSRTEGNPYAVGREYDLHAVLYCQGVFDNDGTRVVYGSGAPSGLWRVAASGGEPAPLTTTDPEQGQVNHAWPHILPGGRAVLFTILTDARSSPTPSGGTEPSAYEPAQIAVLNLDTGEHTVLVPGGSNPHYSPTGHIVYGLDGTLWAVGFDRDRLALTTTPVPVQGNVNTKRSGAANFGLSATGSIVYVPGTVRDATTTDLRLVWVDREGRGEPTAPEARAYGSLSVSPDGTRVAVKILGGDLWIEDLVRGGPGTRLTFTPGRGRYPTWTSDGLRVAFRGGPGEALFWKAADGTGGVEPLTEYRPPRLGDASSLSPSASSPDGTALVFGAGSDPGVLWLEGDRAPTLLWESPDFERDYDLSPDGRWLAYQSAEPARQGGARRGQLGPMEVWVRPFPNVTDGVWQVSTNGGRWPLWNPQPDRGQKLFYISPQGAYILKCRQ